MSKKLTTEEFIEKAKAIHGDKYDYSLVDYKNNKTKVKIICPTHGVFETTPHSFLMGSECPICAAEKRKQQNKILSSKEFIEKAKVIHNNKYNYIIEENYFKTYNKIKIICPIHGIFEQTVHSHLQKHGCPKCGFEASHQKMSEKEIIERIKTIHNNKYNYSKIVYKGYFKNIELICPIHGSFFKTPANLIKRKEGCPECSKNKYKGEEKIKNWLEKNGFKNKFQRNYKIKELNYKSYDFFIPNKNLLIEYNGKQHYEPRQFGGISAEKAKQNLKIQKHHDWLKRKYAKNNKINLLTIPYWDFENIDTILETTIYKN